MAVDHGLSGKNSERSKLRREKKARRIKNIAKRLRSEDVPVNSYEVKFDEAARVAWLTGFRKRKQERRKYGIAMQIIKDKKARKDMAKTKKQTLQDQSEELLKAQNLALGSDGQEEEKGGVEGLEQAEETLYADEATQAMFGSAVAVSVQSQLDDSWFGSKQAFLKDDEEQGEEAQEERKTRNRQSEPSKLERALKQANVLMHSSKKNSRRDGYKRNIRSRDLKRKIDSSKLLDKALGRAHSKRSRR
eukprot:gene9321-10289_t